MRGAAPPTAPDRQQLLREKFGHLGRRHVRRHEGCADGVDQDEGEPPTADLLVLGDRLHERVGGYGRAGNVGDAGRQADAGEVGRDAPGVVGCNQPAAG